MENQGRNFSYDSSEMGDEGRNVNRKAGEITGQPQLFKDDFTNQGTNKENCNNWSDFSNSPQGTNYNQQIRNDDYINQGYRTSGSSHEYGNPGYKNSAGGNDDYTMNQQYKNSGQGTDFLQETGGGVINIAQGAVQGAATMAKGAAVGAANIAQGAATAVKSTLGMNTGGDSMPTTTGTTRATTTNNPSYPNARV